MIATRFSVATHILLLLAADSPDRATSLRIAQSVNTNPVVVRRITGQLARAGLVRVKRGPGGAKLRRPPDRITMRDIWRAVNPAPNRPLLSLHPDPDPECPVGSKVHRVLTPVFLAAEDAMEQALGQVTLEELAGQLDPSSRERQFVPEECVGP